MPPSVNNRTDRLPRISDQRSRASSPNCSVAIRRDLDEERPARPSPAITIMRSRRASRLVRPGGSFLACHQPGPGLPLPPPGPSSRRDLRCRTRHRLVVTWDAIGHGLNESAAKDVGWGVNEQFLRQQMENQVGRIDYVLPEGFTSVDQVVRERRETFSALEINYLNENAAQYGYERVGNSWIYRGGK